MEVLIINFVQHLKGGNLSGILFCKGFKVIFTSHVKHFPRVNAKSPEVNKENN